MRDWILEMGEHASSIQAAIDDGRNDEAWHLTQLFQDWCIERINAERYSVRNAGTLLSAPQTFLVKVLLSEHKYRDALVHITYEGVLDERDLKYYPKAIKSVFRKCRFVNVEVAAPLAIYEALKEEPLDFASSFLVIRGAVSTWT